MALSAVVFDVDGTLVDSVDLHAQAWRDAFAEFGHNLDVAEIRGQIGKGGDQLMPVFLSPSDLDRIGPALEHRRSEIFRGQYLDQVRPFPGVRALFERLRGDGVATAIASSAKAEELEDYVRLAGLPGLVTASTSSADAERSKPHPDIFRAMLGKLPGVDTARSVVIGDSPYDARAAAGAGLRTIGVLCGGFAAAELRHAGCVALYADPQHLLARYAEVGGGALTRPAAAQRR